MKIARVGTGYIIVLWALIIALLGSVLYIGYRRNIADLRALMVTEAERLIDVVSVSAEAGIHALDEVEYLTAGRLLDNARLIDLLTPPGSSYLDSLSRIAQNNELHMINILDENGKSISRSSTPNSRPSGSRTGHRPEVESVLSGDMEQEVIGFMESRYYSGKRYGVVVKKREGGAVVVNTDSDKMLEFRKKVGLGNLFRKIGSSKEIHYLVLQDTLGIIAASSGVTEMTRIENDPFLVRSGESDRGSRLISINGEKLLEVVRPLVVDNISLGLLRVGLSTAQIDSISRQSVRQFLILFFAAVISGALLLVYLTLRQNYMILNAEHGRILQEVRIMEEETRRSERLTSMGRLAAGVAHEIRNPLNSISIIAQRIKAEFKTTEDQDEFGSLLSTVGNEISRISIIVENFLKYARPPKLVRKSVLIEELISDIMKITAEKAKNERITIMTDLESGIMCLCDTDQMKQALLNIVLNALDSAQENGSITIRAAQRKRDIILSVEDTGSGIPEENLPKIFDPYFTTKKSGNGLGLSEVYRIVTAHGGSIKAENAEHGGALFSITLSMEKK